MPTPTDPAQIATAITTGLVDQLQRLTAAAARPAHPGTPSELPLLRALQDLAGTSALTLVPRADSTAYTLTPAWYLQAMTTAAQTVKGKAA